MLDDAMKQQLQQYLGLLENPIELVMSLDNSDAAGQMRTLLDDIAQLAAGSGARRQAVCHECLGCMRQKMEQVVGWMQHTRAAQP